MKVTFNHLTNEISGNEWTDDNDSIGDPEFIPSNEDNEDCPGNQIYTTKYY